MTALKNGVHSREYDSSNSGSLSVNSDGCSRGNCRNDKVLIHRVLIVWRDSLKFCRQNHTICRIYVKIIEVREWFGEQVGIHLIQVWAGIDHWLLKPGEVSMGFLRPLSLYSCMFEKFHNKKGGIILKIYCSLSGWIDPKGQKHVRQHLWKMGR